jgi:nitrogen regulatory protein P-II 1
MPEAVLEKQMKSSGVRSTTMKKVEAVIRPEKVDDVRQALEEAGFAGITITEVEGHGKQKGITQVWRGETYRVTSLPKVKVEVVIGESDLEKCINTIVKAAQTGSVGDGKIFVSDISNVIRIRTNERGEAAL